MGNGDREITGRYIYGATPQAGIPRGRSQRCDRAGPAVSVFVNPVVRRDKDVAIAGIGTHERFARVGFKRPNRLALRYGSIITLPEVAT